MNNKLKQAIEEANAKGIDPEVAKKRMENLNATLKELYKQGSQLKQGIDQYRSMNRAQRRIPNNKKQYEAAVELSKVVLSRITMFEQVKNEIEAKS